MKARTLSILACGTILSIAFGVTLAAARQPVSIQGQVDLTTFTGTATADIAGDTLRGTVQVIPMQPPVPKDGGLYFPEVQHVFTFEDGSALTTTGEEFAMPTDENPAIYTLHGNMQILTGTGAFEGAGGELHVNGQMDYSVNPGQATFAAHGVISR
ncbi:MAG: hypothetical protein ACYTAS_08790 [Planctomycetota bacterium]|jgi:hypothetical protein